MITFNDRISIRQLQILIILNILGTSIIIIPRKVAEHAMEDSWLSIIIGVIFAIVSTILIATVTKKNGTKSFAQVCKSNLSIPIGILVCIAFVIKIILTVGLELNVFTQMTNEVMLPSTPNKIISVSMLLISGYLASKGLEARARAGELLIYFVFIFIGLNIIISFYNSDFSNLTPVLKSSTSDIGKGAMVVFFTFSSIEYIFFMGPYIQNKKQIVRGTALASFFVGCVIFLVVIVSIAKFSAEGVTHKLWPVMEMMNSISLPGSFIERQDAFIMSFWIFMVFASTSAGIYFIAIILKDVIGKGTHFFYVCVAIVLCFLVSMLPQDASKTAIYLDYIYLFLGVTFMVILPILLIITTKFREMRSRRRKNV